MDDAESQPPVPLASIGGIAVLLVGVSLAALAVAEPLSVIEIIAVDVVIVFLTPLALRTLAVIGEPVPKWVVFDIVGIVAAVVFSGHLGVILPHTFVLGMLGAMLFYDVVAVHFTGFMEQVGTNTLDWGVPMTVVVPLSRSFSFDAFRAHVDDNGLSESPEPELACSVIGLGDLVMPGAATVAVATAGVGGPVAPVTTALGAGAGLVALQVLYDGDVAAGLAGIVPGTMVGYLFGAVVMGVPVATALGL